MFKVYGKSWFSREDQVMSDEKVVVMCETIVIVVCILCFTILSVKGCA